MTIDERCGVIVLVVSFGLGVAVGVLASMTLVLDGICRC